MQIATMTSAFFYQRGQSETILTVDSMRRLKQAGFSHLDLNLCMQGRGEGELAGEDWKRHASDIRNEAEKLGITFVQSHAPFMGGGWMNPANTELNGIFLKMLPRAAEILDIVGVPYTVVHPMFDPSVPADNWEANMKATLDPHREFLELLAKKGISPAFENMIAMPGKPRFCSTADELIRLTDELKQYNPTVCWDFGHGNLSRPDQCEDIRKLKGRVTCVHVHDNHGKLDEHLMPFMGSICWEEVLPALRDAGFAGDLVLEVGICRNMPDCLKNQATLLQADASRLLLDLYRGNGQ